jgi:NAD(P)-dependent dehydrogenase (short-subunit alcohol dehydrogenase family)
VSEEKIMNELTGQTILVTGAKGGLGTHVTQAFIDAGAKVIGSSRAIQDADFPNPNFAAIPADLTNADAARQLAAGVLSRFQKIDALVHVMGGFAGGQPIPETDDATWDRMMNLNLRSAFNTLRAVIPAMRQAKRGRIVAIGSRAALEPSANIAAYNASKAGLVALVRTAALENKDLGITANVILPGTMNTEANRKADAGADQSKWIDPRRVAALTVFLASDAAAQITAAAIPIYGQEL